MAAKEVKKATENLSCPVCFQVYKNPKYLSCYHSYCEECLEKLCTPESKIICPECRKEVTIPEGGVKSLPNNFLINRLVDELILKCKVEGEGEVWCDNCDEKDPVVSYCPNCNLFLCHVCNESHKRDRRSVTHMQDIVPFTEPKTSKDVPVYTKAKTLMCDKHDTELLFYCETCGELVCLYCTTKEHSGHHHDAVKQLAEKHRQELKTATAPIKGMIDNLSKAYGSLDKMVKEIQKCGNEVERNIDQYYDEVIQKLVKQKEEMKQHLQYTVSQKTKAITLQKEELECMQEKVRSVVELKDAVEKSSDQEMMSTKKQLINRVQEITNGFRRLNIHPVQSATMEFMPTEKPFPKFGQLFTHIDPSASEVAHLPQYAFAGQKVEFTITTKYYSGHYCSRGGSQVIVQLEYTTKETTVALVKDNGDGSYTVSFIPGQTGKTKLFVSINGLQIREDLYTFMVRKSYLAVSKPSNIVDNNGSMGQPWGIAFSQNGIWAVTDTSKHCVYLFDERDELIAKIGSRGNNSGRFYSPYGVAFDADNNLYVADGGNHRVQKFDTNGEYLLQFGSKGASNGQLNNPHGVVIHDDKVYVADCSNCRISVFKKNSGKFCCVIGKGYLDAPHDLSINANNVLFVVDHDRHSICSFTLEGEVVNVFGSKGKYWGQLKNPSSLVIDMYGFILVADSGNHCMSIFDKDGNCINCIGSIVGSLAGEFNCPRGVALSSDGSIYISDSANKRVQVFSTF